MKRLFQTSLMFLTLSALQPLARAAAPTVMVGAPAPKLQTGRWVQGEAVAGFEKGKAYIVEFWATWCGPCRVSIPHLNEIHNRFKDKGLIVIGQDCWENDEKQVEPFIKTMGEKMTYRVALDTKTDDAPRGKMAETWMAAAAQNGIPTAFIVDPKGILAWVGHPMTLTDSLIESILNGTHDIKKAAAAFEQSVKESQEWMAAQAPIAKVRESIRKENWDQAYADLAEAEKKISKERADGLRTDILLAKRDYAGVEAMAEQKHRATSGGPLEAQMAMPLNEIAWRMALDPRISNDDLKRAEKIAKWADDASGHKNPMIMDTLARVLFRLEKRTEAIALQEKAVGLATDSLKEQLAQTLESYRKGQLPKGN